MHAGAIRSWLGAYTVVCLSASLPVDSMHAARLELMHVYVPVFTVLFSLASHFIQPSL